MPLRTALAKSKNMVSIRVLQSVGVKYAQEWITRFGFGPRSIPAYLTMALGAGSVTPMQMAQATRYSPTVAIASRRNSLPASPTAKGRQLEPPQAAPPSEDRRAIERATPAARVTRSGTAARAQATLKRSDIYGKTGNQRLHGRLVCRLPSHLVAVVWIGYDQPRKLGDKRKPAAACPCRFGSSSWPRR